MEDRLKQFAELRQRAEAVLLESPPESITHLTPEEIQKTVHNLRVHQVELEMQNDDLRRALVDLDVSRARYFDFYNLAPVGYFTISSTGLIQEANLTAASCLGLTQSELINQPLTNFVFHQDQDLYYLFRKQLLGPDAVKPCDLRVVRDDDSVFWARLRAVAVQDSDGSPVGRLMLSDITEYKLAEAAQRKSAEEFERLFREAPLGIALIDSLTGEIYAVNPMFANIAGRTMEEMARIDWMSITHPDDVQGDLDNMALLNAGKITGFKMEKRYLHHDGAVVWINMTIAPIHVDDKAHPRHLCMIEDISDRKLAEQQLLEKNAELKSFTYTVSHDLKSPLITIQAYAGMMLKDLEAGKHKRVQEDLKAIERAASKLSALLNDLLELSRAGRQMSEPSPVDMNLLAKECLAQLTGVLKQRHVEVVVQPDLPAITGDQKRITEVVQNLVENAIKYRGDQAVPRIEIGARQEGKETVFFVSDNGIGIDPSYQERIFGLFNKLDPKSEGTGVGLALVKRIIEVHGGQVWVESEGAGKGSRFCFTLPK